MSTFTGKLKKLAVKTGVGKRGAWALYSGKMQKQDGSEYEEWLSFGFEKPKAEEGGWYEITAEKDDRGYFQVKAVKPIESPKAAVAPSAAAVEAVMSAGGPTVQNYIHYQSARSNALSLVELATKLDALPLIQTKGKAGEAKRYEELTALVDKLTVQYYNDTNTLRLLGTVQDAGAIENPDEEVVATPGEED